MRLLRLLDDEVDREPRAREREQGEQPGGPAADAALTPSPKSSVANSASCSVCSWSVASRKRSTTSERIVCRIDRRASGAASARRAASAIASSRSASAGTSRSQSPIAKASSPLMRSPKESTSSARCGPTTAGSVTVRPKPWWIPSREKFATKRDSGLATRKSAVIATPSPPPTAAPCTAATTGVSPATSR